MEKEDRSLKTLRTRIFRHVLAVVRDTDSAEDICQEVLRQVWVGLGSFRGEASVSSWTHRITLNAICTFYRRESVEGKAREKWAVGLHGTDGDLDLDNQIDLGSLDEALKDLSRFLPKGQRADFAQWHFHGLRPAEIARSSGRCPGTVRANLHKARRNLRHRLLSERPRLVSDLLPVSRTSTPGR
jgi:RNA polymerase sigma-70 factor (ECF subfamily)